jgi:hypothetical protein
MRGSLADMVDLHVCQNIQTDRAVYQQQRSCSSFVFQSSGNTRQNLKLCRPRNQTTMNRLSPRCSSRRFFVVIGLPRNDHRWAKRRSSISSSQCRSEGAMKGRPSVAPEHSPIFRSKSVMFPSKKGVTCRVQHHILLPPSADAMETETQTEKIAVDGNS